MDLRGSQSRTNRRPLHNVSQEEDISNRGESNYSTLTRELSESQETARNLSVRVSALERQRSALERHVEVLTAKLQEEETSKSTDDRRKADIGNLKEHVARLSERNESVLGQLKEKEEQNSRLKSNLNAAERMINNLKEQVSASKAATLEEQDKVLRIQRKLAEREADFSHIQEQLRLVQAENKDLRLRLDDDRHASHETLVSLRDTCYRLQEQLKAESATSKKVRQEALSLRDEIQSIRQKYASLLEEARRRDENSSALRQRIIQLVQEEETSAQNSLLRRPVLVTAPTDPDSPGIFSTNQSPVPSNRPVEQPDYKTSLSDDKWIEPSATETPSEDEIKESRQGDGDAGYHTEGSAISYVDSFDEEHYFSGPDASFERSMSEALQRDTEPSPSSLIRDRHPLAKTNQGRSFDYSPPAKVTRRFDRSVSLPVTRALEASSDSVDSQKSAHRSSGKPQTESSSTSSRGAGQGSALESYPSSSSSARPQVPSNPGEEGLRTINPSILDSVLLEPLRCGGILSKFAYNSSKRVRRFVMLDHLTLRWGNPKTQKLSSAANLLGVKSLVHGPELFATRSRQPSKDPPWLCFSLVFPHRSLDFAALDEQQLFTWYLGFQVIFADLPMQTIYTSTSLRAKMNRMKLDSDLISSRTSPMGASMLDALRQALHRDTLS